MTVMKLQRKQAYEAEPEAGAVRIDRVPAETIRVAIAGTAPLLVHRFSEKAKQMMLDRMRGKRTPKLAKDPEREYQDAFYRFEDGGYGFPVLGFKSATVDAARFYGKDVTMTGLRQFMFFKGEVGATGEMLVRITGEPHMDENVVRLGRGGTDLRYRPMFTEWSTSLTVVYVTSALTRGSVLSLIDAGGMGVGVGEWRPQNGGLLGTYRIDDSIEVEVIK